jgi:hypothetical protein
MRAAPRNAEPSDHKGYEQETLRISTGEAYGKNPILSGYFSALTLVVRWTVRPNAIFYGMFAFGVRIVPICPSCPHP